MMLPREVFVAHGPIILSQGTEDAALIRSLYDLHGWLYELEKEGTHGDYLPETSKEVIRCIRDHGLNRFQHQYEFRLVMPISMTSMTKKTLE